MILLLLPFYQKIIPFSNYNFLVIIKLMKGKQSIPTIWLSDRQDSQPFVSHRSVSTFQTSDNIMTARTSPNKKQSELNSKLLLAKDEAETVSLLRKELKSIKLQVNKLIEEGFVKTQVPSQWLESSGNLSSLSKSSKISSIINADFYTQSDSKSRKIQQSLSNHSNSLEQLNNLRQQNQKLKIMCRQKQTQTLTKQKRQNQQIKALRRNKQQLTKCIQILQFSLRETNLHLKNFIAYSQKLEKQKEQGKNQMQAKHQEIERLDNIIHRLEEEIQYRKAENNQLIRIIYLKENQVEELKINFSSKIRALQIQYQRAMSNNQSRTGFQDSFQKRRKAKSIDPKDEAAFRKNQIDRLNAENVAIRSELAQKQRVMNLMLNDIRIMDRQLQNFDLEHHQLLRCRKLIEFLNQKLITIDAKHLSSKYRYC